MSMYNQLQYSYANLCLLFLNLFCPGGTCRPTRVDHLFKDFDNTELRSSGDFCFDWFFFSENENKNDVDSWVHRIKHI